MRHGIAWALLLLGWASTAGAHTMTLTEVTISFARPGRLDVNIGIDLTQILGSPESYYRFVTESEAAQRADVRPIVQRVLNGIRFVAGDVPLQLELRRFSTSTADKALIIDSQMSTLTTFEFTAMLPPAGSAPLTLRVPVGAPVDYPVVYTILIPDAHISMTRWLEDGMHASAPFAWANKVPHASSTAVSTAGGAARFDPDALPWQQRATVYLRLGFKHIVPDGTDHILFVLGLFFLGITWRKLLSQTTVFTVAHATTLFLSTYGIFTLPSRYVEPGIALSIAWIAFENVFHPRLSSGRLAVVFGFGLVHGLGFATSLSDIPFPTHDFFIALLGFNFGVDAGQLFVIAIAFLIVGWFRNAPWFRRRIAIPASLVIAAIGLFWAIQRVIFYSTHR